MRVRLFGLGLICALVLGGSAMAQQSRIPDVQEAQKIFFNELYFSGGFTLFCGAWFGVENRRDGTVRKPLGIGMTHVYPPVRMKEITPCPDSMSVAQCRNASRRFRIMEADLHNTYPALSFVDAERGASLFGMIPGENRLYESCDIERSKRAGIVEPRAEVRGNIARSIMYMHSTYNVSVAAKMRSVLLRWHRDDPVSEQERRRNDRIAGIQGTRNPYIDNPALMKNLRWNKTASK